MHRALSAEHLAELARGTINGLRRFIPGRDVEDESLASATKAVEERCSRGNKPQLQAVTTMVEHFCDEVRSIITSSPVAGPSSPGGDATSTATATSGAPTTSSGGATPTTPPTLPPLAPPQAAKARKASEAAIIHFFECLRVTYRLLGTAIVAPLIDTHAVQLMLELIDAAPVSKKLYDAAFACACDFLAESQELFLDVVETLAGRIGRFAAAAAAATADEGGAPPEQLATLSTIRVMMLLIAVLKRADIISVAASNEVKSRLASHGLVASLLRIADHCRQIYEANNVAAAEHLMCGTAALTVVGSVIRSNLPNKDEVLSTPKFFDNWVFYASNLAKLECSFSIHFAEDVPLVLESAAVWAAELAECLIEVCSRDSFAIRRQSMYSDLGLVGHAAAAAAPAESLHPGMTSANPDPFVVVRKWEVLPQNWDAILASGAVFVWRLASAANPCVLSVQSCRHLLGCLKQLDISSQLTEFVFRAVVASLLLLCRANPLNITMLSAAGAFEAIVTMLTTTGSVLRANDGGSSGPPSSATSSAVTAATAARVSLSLNHPAWPITLALLSTIVSTQCDARQLQALMSACERMITSAITHEDCEIIEHCFLIIGTSVYARQLLWFDGRSSAVVCPVDRFCGRWYGYTFLTWINPPCVWSEGCLLFSYSEPTTPSKTVVSIVANGRSRCLSVRSTNNKELTITLLPEATIGEGWNHIGIVHNISGFSVFINGKKCCTNNSVPYPKEPAKGQRLQFCFGGGDPGVPPLLGMMTTAQLVDKDISDRDVERLFLAGPGSTTNTVDPPIPAGELIRLDCSEAVEIAGSLVKDEIDAQEVTFHANPDVPSIMEELKLVNWGIAVIERTREQPENRGSVVVLLLELLSAYVKQCKDGFAQMQEARFIEHLGRAMLSWDNVPQVFPGVLLSLVAQKQNPKLLRAHPVTVSVLQLLLDIINVAACPTVTRCATMKELSDTLAMPSNAKIFREGPKLASVLELSRHVEPECVDDVVSVIEKLVKEPAEMEMALRFLIGEPETKQTTVVKCEITRMLYDVGVAALPIVDVIANAGGVQACSLLAAGFNHSSEALRVYSLRLLALILHCNRKQRDLFLAKGGFEQLALAIEKHCTSGGAPLKVSTFNCLFKFALDYFQPNTPDANPGTAAALGGGNGAQNQQQQRQHHDPRVMPAAFNGHMPSLLPQRNVMRRTYSMGSVGSECSDIEARLSIDDTYQSQSKARDTIVYPQCVAVTIALLRPLIDVHPSDGSEGLLHPEPSADGIASDIPETSSSTSQKDAQELEVVLKVLGYLERLVDMQPNAIALAPHPWMDWLWASLARPLSDESFRARNKGFVRKVELGVRNFTRKIAVVDLARQSRQSYIRKMRDCAEAPELQRIVMEEVVRHFSSNNRLDVMDSAEANNVLKNLDQLLMGIDECIAPFPMTLGLEIIQAVGMIAGQNTAWVRTKMRNGKYFDTRKQLSFFVLTSIRSFSRETPEFVRELLDANMHEPNASLFVMKSICDGVRERSVEAVETLQSMLRALYSMDEEQRRTVVRVLGEQELVDLFIQQRRVVDGVEVEAENLIAWTVEHEAKWEQAAQRVARAAKALEGDISARNERREKERASRMRTRKAEIDRRVAQVAKSELELDKMRADADLRFAVTHAEQMAEVVAQRAARERERVKE